MLAVLGFVLVKLRVYGFNSSLLMFLHVTLLITVLAAPTAFMLYYNLGPLASAPVAIGQLVLSMKLHSYRATNEILRDMQERKKRGVFRVNDENNIKDFGVAYPANVRLKGFLLYLMFPTLVYETEFPRTERVRWRVVARAFGWGSLSLSRCVVLKMNSDGCACDDAHHVCEFPSADHYD